MTPEEVCKMIDTIYEGKPYELKLSDDASASADSDGFTFFAAPHKSYFDVTGPRQAREIAAALVAWADHKEGRNTPSEIADFLPAINPVIATGLAKPHPEE